MRTIWAGERRWRAVHQLTIQERLPPALADGLPVIEREASDAERLLIALVENGQREGLSPWEDAQALAAYQGMTGLSARALAKQVGRAREDDDEKGVRDVQRKIKTAREATPEAIAQYERDGNWERLRDSVSAAKPKPTLDLTPKLALALGELALKALREPSEALEAGYTQLSGAIEGGPLATLRERGLIAVRPVGFDPPRYYGRVLRASSPAGDWLKAIGFDVAPQGAVFSLRAAVLGDLKADAFGPDQYFTTGLNPPAGATLGEQPPAPPGDQTASDAEPPLIAAEEEEEKDLALSAKEYLLLAEVAHATADLESVTTPAPDAPAGGSTFIPADKYWLSQEASGLQTKGLVAFRHSPAGADIALTKAGRERSPLAAASPYLEHDGWMAQLGEARAAAGAAPIVEGEQVYHFAWINTRPAVAPAASPAPAEVQPDLEEEAEAAQAKEALALAQALCRDKIFDPRSDADAFLVACHAAGLAAPLVVSDDPNMSGALIRESDARHLAAVDPDGVEFNDLAQARAMLIAMAFTFTRRFSAAWSGSAKQAGALEQV